MSLYAVPNEHFAFGAVKSGLFVRFHLPFFRREGPVKIYFRFNRKVPRWSVCDIGLVNNANAKKRRILRSKGLPRPSICSLLKKKSRTKRAFAFEAPRGLQSDRGGEDGGRVFRGNVTCRLAFCAKLVAGPRCFFWKMISIIYYRTKTAKARS